MKLQLEEIRPDANSSFRLLLTPHLNDFYYWHFHPEFELVFIENADGPRHVGDHRSRYEGSDLVLIGPHIPHLNFDYGVRTDYRKVVVQLREDFLSGSFGQMPELSDIVGLFERARQGVSFGGETKRRAGERLSRLPGLTHFRQWMELLDIFQFLALSDEAETLHPQPVHPVYNRRDQQRIRRVYEFIDQHYHRPMTIPELADLTSLTPEAFCRYFRKMTRMTFTEFVNQYRIREAKRRLLLDQTVTEVCFACGFESLSYFNRIFRRVTGLSPRAYRGLFKI